MKAVRVAARSVANAGRIVLVGSALLSLSCRAKPAQLLVIVDTDAALGAQLFTDPSISPDATIDTIRIDRFDEAWNPTCLDDVDCTANYILPDPSLWPFSFGVKTPATGGAPLHLRLRAFRGAVAARGTDTIEDHVFATIDPPTEATIDRLIEVAFPASGEVVVRVLLAEECLGAPVAFGKSPHTCVDGASRAALPSNAIAVVSSGDTGSSLAGRWPRARAVECGAQPPGVDALCIPGGFSYIGEAALASVDEQGYVPAVPPRPVYLSPFFMDRTEFTVGRLRQLVNQGFALTPGDPSGPVPADTQLAQCQWLGADQAANDEYPLNCISWTAAQRACAMSGGDLPREAEWEYAARGRGEGRIYPWGAISPECGTSSAGRGTSCPGGLGPEPVGLHAQSSVCGGVCDVSRDGVVDLGGNVTELCADKLIPYADGCWSAAGIFINPHCEDQSVDQRATRGGDWSSGPANTRSAFRRGDSKDSLHGFRCVYREVKP